MPRWLCKPVGSRNSFIPNNFRNGLARTWPYRGAYEAGYGGDTVALGAWLLCDGRAENLSLLAVAAVGRIKGEGTFNLYQLTIL